MSTPTCSTADEIFLLQSFDWKIQPPTQKDSVQSWGSSTTLHKPMSPTEDGEKTTHLLIYHIERRFIDQSNIKSLLPTPENSVPRSIKHFPKRNDITSLALRDNFVFPRDEFIIAFKEPGFSIFLQDPGYLGTGRKYKSQSAFEKDMLDDGRHLGCIGREVEEGLHVGEAIVGIKVVDTYTWRYKLDVVDLGRWKNQPKWQVLSAYMPLI